MKQLHKIRCTSLILLLIPVLVLAQETNYITPQYTKVFGDQIEDLPGTGGIGDNYKYLTFDNISNDFGNNDGFMVFYEPNRYYTSGGTHDVILMGFYNNNNKLLEIYYKGETLLLRRYDNNQVFIDYVLFDKMFYKDFVWPKFKIYVTGHFIWIEDGEYGYTTPNAHSPLFWGIDISRNTNISSFTQRSSNAKIQLYQNYISSYYTDEDIQIYAFKLSDLNKELRNYTRGNYGAAKSAGGKNNDFIVKTLAVEDVIVNRIFGVYPNPVKDELFITLSSNKNNKIELIDIQGRLLYQAEVSGAYEHTVAIKEFNISPGMIFVRSTTEDGVKTKKVIVKN